MDVADFLELPVLHGSRVVAGSSGLHQRVRWVHVVDLSDPLPWIDRGMLMLSTGIAWPRQDEELAALVHRLAERGVAALGLAVPHYFARFPDAMRAAADEVGLPLIEIPWEIPFVRITETVHQLILREQWRELERAEQLHRELMRAAARTRSLDRLVRTLGELLGRSITVEEPDGRLLAYYQCGPYEDEARRATIESGRAPAWLQEGLLARGYLPPQGTQPYRVPAFPELGLRERVVCPIWLHGELVGLVWIIEGDEPLSGLDLRAAEHAALVFALLFAQQRELAQLEARLGYAFLSTVLEGRFSGSPQELERARALGYDPARAYRVLVLLLPEPPLTVEAFQYRERIALQIGRALRERGAAPLVAALHDQVIVFLERDELLAEVTRTIDLAVVTAVAGRPYPGPDGARRSYREACSLLEYVRSPGVYRYEDLILERVLAGDAEARTAFRDVLLGPLQRARHGERLAETLFAWVDARFSVKEAATQLGLHPNTVRYRLEQIAALLARDLEDPETRFELQLLAKVSGSPHPVQRGEGTAPPANDGVRDPARGGHAAREPEALHSRRPRVTGGRSAGPAG